MVDAAGKNTKSGRVLIPELNCVTAIAHSHQIEIGTAYNNISHKQIKTMIFWNFKWYILFHKIQQFLSNLSTFGLYLSFTTCSPIYYLFVKNIQRLRSNLNHNKNMVLLYIFSLWIQKKSWEHEIIDKIQLFKKMNWN